MLCKYLFRFIPESVRWLNLRGRQEEAMKILRRIAKFNKKEIPSEITLKSQTGEGKTSGNFVDLLKPLYMAKQTSVQFYAWYVSRNWSIAVSCILFSLKFLFTLLNALGCRMNGVGTFADLGFFPLLDFFETPNSPLLDSIRYFHIYREKYPCNTIT